MTDSRAVLRGRPRLRRWFALAVPALLALIAAPDAAQAQCQYEVTAIIQAPPCFITGPPPTFAGGMNVHGHVVGYYWDCVTSGVDHGFVWTPENGFVTLPTPEGAYRNTPSDINDSGFIVGTHTFWQGDTQRGYIFDPATQEYTYFEPKHGAGHSWANAINYKGLVAGARSIGEPGESPNPFNAVIWDTKTGEVIDLGVLNGPNSTAKTINEMGEVAGDTGNIFQFQLQAWTTLDGTIAVIDHVPGAYLTQAAAISNTGIIAGGGAFSTHPDGLHSQAALWHKGKWNLLPMLPGADGGGALGLNDLGQRVGRNTGPERATLWQHDEVHELAQLVVDAPSTSGFQRAIQANNAGQILVRGHLSGKTVGYLLMPVDRPLTDLNADCTTDVHDLLMLIMQWGPCATDDCPADFTDNGIVNVFDLLFLLANWG